VYCKKLDSIRTKLTEEIDFKVYPYVDSGMALLQQHSAWRDILIEPVARHRAAIEAWGHSKLGAQSGRKNQPACLSVSPEPHARSLQIFLCVLLGPTPAG